MFHCYCSCHYYYCCYPNPKPLLYPRKNRGLSAQVGTPKTSLLVFNTCLDVPQDALSGFKCLFCDPCPFSSFPHLCSLQGKPCVSEALSMRKALHHHVGISMSLGAFATVPLSVSKVRNQGCPLHLKVHTLNFLLATSQTLI